MSATLPDSITTRQRFKPIEDGLLLIMRTKLDGIQVQSRIEADQTFPLVLARGRRSPAGSGGDRRFVESSQIEFQVFADGIDSEDDAARISEAVRVALFEAADEQFRFPGYGYLSWVEMASQPHAAPDWATATGPVQYADLPSGVTRYETKYTVEVRRQG